MGRRGRTKGHRRMSGLCLVRYRLARSDLRAGNWDAGAWRPHDARSAASATRIGRPRSRRRRCRRGFTAVRYQRHDEHDGRNNPVRTSVRACAGTRSAPVRSERLTTWEKTLSHAESSWSPLTHCGHRGKGARQVHGHSRFHRAAVLDLGLGRRIPDRHEGMGGGSLMMPLLILLFGIQLATAVGTDLLAIGMSRGTGHWRIAPRPVSAVILHKTECWPALQSQKPSNGKRRAEPVIWIGGPCLPAGFFLTVRQLASKRAGCG